MSAPLSIHCAKIVAAVTGALRKNTLLIYVLIGGCVVSAWTHSRLTRTRSRYDDARRDGMITYVQSDIRNRGNLYESMLHVAGADSAVSDDLTNCQDWHRFVDQIELFSRNAAIKSISLVPPVPSTQPLIYAEADQATQHVMWNLATESPALLAAERPRDTGLPALTAITRLLSEENHVRLVVPVYREKRQTTVAGRRTAITAWVTPVRSGDVYFRSSLGPQASSLDLRLFEGSAAPYHLAFTSSETAKNRPSERTSILTLEGTTWILGWNRTPNFPFVSKMPSVWALCSCLVVTLILATLVFRLQRTALRVKTSLTLEAKKAEETEAFLAALVQSSDDSIVGTTLDGTIVSWNSGSERLWGYTAEEAIGKPITILFSPEERPGAFKNTEKVKHSQRIERFEATRMRKDGVMIDVSAILSPIKDGQGRLLGVSAVYSDITGRKRAELELRSAKEAAEVASRAKSEFLANVSHEIRTPLNGILGMTELVLDTDLDAEQRECLSVAKFSADALLILINDILDFSKIEAGKLDFERCGFRITESVEAVVMTLALNAHQKGLELVCDVHHSVPEVVVGDRHRIQQVLVNLINNAVKFTERGEVIVSLEAIACNEGDRGNGSSLCELQFAVRDTGTGIPPEQQRRIFEAFTQADGSYTRRFGGTGLGLTISNRLVETMGGRLWVESEAQQGSTFYVTLPVQIAEMNQPPSLPARLASLQNLRVLVVDDNDVNRRLLDRWLTRWGARTVTAGSVSTAVEILESTRAQIDLLVTDLHMPESDRFELIKRAQIQSTPTVVMLTLDSYAQDLQRTRDLGVQAHLTKPLRQSDLSDAILCALQAHPSASSRG